MRRRHADPGVSPRATVAAADDPRRPRVAGAAERLPRPTRWSGSGLSATLAPVRRVGLLVLVLLACLATPALAQDPAPPAPAPPVTGQVIMDGAWDGPRQPRSGGLPQGWGGLQVKPRGRAICFSLSCARHALRLVATPLRDGTRAARFEVRDGDNPFGDAERSEVQGVVTGRAGDLRWYTMSIYLPPDFRTAGANDARFMHLTQWAVERGSPPIGIYIFRGNLVLQVSEQASPNRFLAVHRPWGTLIGPLRGRWVDLALFVRWSQGPTGEVRLWLDGVQQPMTWPFGGTHQARHGGVGAMAYTGRTLVPRGGPTFVRQGIARSQKLRGRTVVFHDAMRVYATTTVPPSPPPPLPPPAPTLPPPA
jgi:Polysaccharide lyase